MVRKNRYGLWDMRCVILTALVLLTTVYAGAQEVHATARVDSNSITIGDWLKLYVEVEHPSNVAVTWPTLTDSLDGLEIVHRDENTKKQSSVEQPSLYWESHCQQKS